MRLLIAIIVFIAFLALSATVVKNAPTAAAGSDDNIKVYFSADSFDATGYVETIWASRVMPHVRDTAVELRDLIDAIGSGDEAFLDRHGYRAVAEGNPYNFAVKGRVKILSANVKSRNGRLEADVMPYDGEADITIQVGPIYKGTAIRDLLPFVTFDDFKNQVEFAKLASELNSHSRTTVIEPAGLEDGGVGRELYLYGATTQNGTNSHLTVVPVILEPVAE